MPSLTTRNKGTHLASGRNDDGVSVTASNKEAVRGKDLVVLAVKPQNLAEMMTGLNGCLEPNQLVLSIIAGARIKTICQGLSHSRVVRAMPNTPARVGSGISAWTATAEVTGEQKEFARAVLTAMGREISSEPPTSISWSVARGA